jgi:hypothetical protein
MSIQQQVKRDVLVDTVKGKLMLGILLNFGSNWPKLEKPQAVDKGLSGMSCRP